MQIVKDVKEIQGESILHIEQRRWRDLPYTIIVTVSKKICVLQAFSFEEGEDPWNMIEVDVFEELVKQLIFDRWKLNRVGEPVYTTTLASVQNTTYIMDTLLELEAITEEDVKEYKDMLVDNYNRKLKERNDREYREYLRLRAKFGS